MRKKLMLALVLFIPALWLRAQEGNPGRDVWISADTYPPTVEGCLRNANLHYMVVAHDGTVYNLTGNTAKLRNYVGSEIEITGRPTVISLDTTMTEAASTVEELPALDVNSVKELSKTCNATN
jgi:hypothetical protein